MAQIIIFAGTMEGRKLAEAFEGSGLFIHVCVATEYGETLLPKGDTISITSKRLDANEMEQLIEEKQASMVIDATHPYATVVSKHIKLACSHQSVDYIRLVRSSLERKGSEGSDEIYVGSVEEAAAYLKGTKGSILITTGSKELEKYTQIADYKTRCYARVLSTKNVVEACEYLGFTGKNLICMQGPFSKELNYAMLKQIDAAYMVTKESGKAGGFLEKIEACHQAGVIPIVVGRPTKEEGLSYEDCLVLIKRRFSLELKRTISLVGIGMGSRENRTIEVEKVCKQADVLIGADRILKTLEQFQKPMFASYQATEICEFINRQEAYQRIVIALSGDTGFYSGAKNLISMLGKDKVRVYPGISSGIYLCAAIKISWEEVKFYSAHGRNENLLQGILNHEKVFALLGGEDAVANLCEKLMAYGMDEVTLYVGEQLSYPDEKITVGVPKELRTQKFSKLCSILIENPEAKNRVITHGIADEAFIRGTVPMTKEEIRSVVLSKLQLKKDSILYDIGAGTGSVSVEMALQVERGVVYAIEKKEEAVLLIEENKKKFGVDNLIVIKGEAPEAMEELSPPTHIFVGGSGGEVRHILTLALQKNPKVRIVISAITLETMTEAMTILKELPIKALEVIQVSVSKAKKVGNYHMMMGQNPVFILSCTGGKNNVPS